ncbi:hypothetical protein MJM25_28475, partial [Salmonella enterica subsp. enterica serovar Lubbock]|nr:hypothetical protein [Salmonella enterica subsp. enterica serovar Lubbock]
MPLNTTLWLSLTLVMRGWRAMKSCVAELRETRWLDGQSRQMVRVRIGAAISQAMPGATMLAL